MRADFVANASHELRTPLAALSGFIETLQGSARDDTKARERFLAIMQEQARRMARLIDDLLSLSRIELNAHLRPDKPVDLVAIVRQVVDGLQTLARDRGVTVTFGATDMPLKSEDVAKNSFVQFPVINGAVVPLLNLPGIKPGELTLDGPTIAKIFLGEITKWNDPAIAKLNPGIKLPDTAIAVVHRSDGSGTTFIWTNYLSKVSPEWKDKVGENTAVEWPVGIGAKGSEGVANNTANTVGALGYVEYAYAKQNNLTYAKMLNHAGKVVAPTAESFLAAAASADWANAQDFRVIITDAPGEKSWPVAGSTFILMQTVPTDIASSSEALKFFDWGYKNGKQMAADLDYVPMPDNVVALIEKTWKDKIKSSDGKPVY